MAKFVAGFLAAYLIGAVPMGIIVARIGKPVPSIIFHAMVWPSVMFRVADAAIIDNR